LDAPSVVRSTRSRSASVALIVEYVRRHPGCTRSGVALMLGINKRTPHLSSLLDEACASGEIRREIDYDLYPSVHRFYIAS
jgi:DNA-binding transcriptional regulator LsrR (DeoR family)